MLLAVYCCHLLEKLSNGLYSQEGLGDFILSGGDSVSLC